VKETTEQDLGNTRSPETETENRNPAKVESKRILIIGIMFINTWNRLDTPKTRLRGRMFLRVLKSLMRN